MSVGAGVPRVGPSERLYRRLGDRYVYVLLWIGGVSIVLLTPVAAALLEFAYARASWGEYARTLAVVMPWMALVAVAAEVMNARATAPLMTWLREGRPVSGAADAWTAAVIRMPRVVARGTVTVVVGALPAAYYGLAVLDHTSAAWIVAGFVGIAIFVVAGGALHYLLWERLLMPVVADVTTRLPADFRPQTTAHSLRGKLLVLVLAMTALTSMIASGVSTDSFGIEGKVVIAIATSLVVTGTLALAMTLLMRRSLIAPLSELLAAMDRVGHGDLDVNLPPISADELGIARRHFNEMVADLRGSIDELRAAQARIVAASAEARRRVERDLHDGAQQHLVLMNLKLGLLARTLGADPKASKLVSELRGDLDRALAELRDLAHGIYPAILTSDGLPGALAEAACAAAIPTTVDCDGAGRYSPDLEAAVYFCCLEALQNAAKHAGDGANARIALAQQDGELRFEVRDDGAGFDDAGAAASSGLQGMADRIGALGGELQVESVPGKGTTIAGTVPVAAV
jgi:signal transduction histidine kinase